MRTARDIENLLEELSRSGSVESALSSALGLLCREGACSAGFVVGAGWTSAANRWASYGSAEAVDELSELYSRGALSGRIEAGGPSRALTMPLLIGQREVGSLWLARDSQPQWSPVVRTRIRVLKTILATLMAAVDIAVTDVAHHVLGSSHFRTQLDREIARSKRQELEFSLILARLELPRPASGQSAMSQPWGLVVSVGGRLADRLRATDAVGVVAPDLLGILLPDTGRIGAMIAGRRVGELLPVLAQQEDAVSLPPGSWRLAAQCYPRDGVNAKALIDSALAAMTQQAEDTQPVTDPQRQTASCGGGEP